MCLCDKDVVCGYQIIASFSSLWAASTSLQLGTARPRTRVLCAGTGVGGGLLVGKMVQEVWEKKRKKGEKIIIINKC